MRLYTVYHPPFFPSSFLFCIVDAIENTQVTFTLLMHCKQCLLDTSAARLLCKPQVKAKVRTDWWQRNGHLQKRKIIFCEKPVSWFMLYKSFFLLLKAKGSSCVTDSKLTGSLTHHWLLQRNSRRNKTKLHGLKKKRRKKQTNKTKKLSLFLVQSYRIEAVHALQD